MVSEPRCETEAGSSDRGLAGQGVHQKWNQDSPGCLDVKVKERINGAQRRRLQEALPLSLLGSPSPSSASPALIPLQEAGGVRSSSVTPKSGSCSGAGPELGGIEHDAVPLSLSRKLREMGTAPAGAIETGRRKCPHLRTPQLQLSWGVVPGQAAREIHSRPSNPGSARAAAAPTSFS